MEVKRKNFYFLDILKFLCALTIIMAHFASERGSFPAVVDYAFSIYIIAVPFFFCCSGFLFFKKFNSLPDDKAKREYFISYEKRIFTMYGLWSLIYLPFIIGEWIVKNTLTVETVLKHLHRALVIQTYATIWFLPALGVGIAILYFLLKASERIKRSACFITALMLILYIFGALGYTYWFLVEGTFLEKIYDLYLLVFKTTRNGLFNAAPFLWFGFLLASKSHKTGRKPFICNLLISLGLLALVVIESFVLKIKFNVSGMDIGIFIFPFTISLMRTGLSLELKERPIYLLMRKLSILMFTSQRLFLSALPAVMPAFFLKLYGTNSYLGMVLVLGLVIGFSFLLIKLSDKIKFLKKLY